MRLVNKVLMLGRPVMASIIMNFKSINESNEKFLLRESIAKDKYQIYCELGQFLEIASKSHRKSIDIQSFLHWIKPAIIHDQYIVIKNDGDIEPSGYLMWAWVSKKTLSQYFEQDRFVLHPMSWNEGNNLIIVDFSIVDTRSTKSTLFNLYRRARKQVGLSNNQINICIRDSYGKVVKNNRNLVYVR